MKNNHILFLFCLFIVMISCNNKLKEDPSLMQVTGKIDGLRKGTLYLQKVQDSILINVDSTIVDGDSNFTLSDNVSAPEIYYLYLNKKDGDTLNDVITFFGEPGTIGIQTQLNTFESSAKVVGSENHNILKEYQSNNRKFRDQNLDLLQDYFNAQKNLNVELADSLRQLIDDLTLRRYLYAINFSVQHRDKYIAPYIALTQASEAQTKWLDTIAKQLTLEVRNSKYGKELISYIENRKEMETKVKY